MEGLEDLQEVLDGLRLGIEDLADPLRDLRDALDSLEAAQGGASAATQTHAAAATSAVGPQRALGDSMIKSAGDAVHLSGTLGKVQDSLAQMGPHGQAAAAALGVMTIAVTSVIGKLHEWAMAAIEVTEQREELLATFSALSGSDAGGAAALAMVNDLAVALPFATSKIADWARGLMAAGIQGKQLEADIKAVAAATALMGESGGAAAMTLFKRLGDGGPAADSLLKTFKDGGPKADKLLKEMGLSLADIGGQAALAKMSAEQLHEALAKAMAKKGAGAVENMVGDLSTIIMRAKEGFRSLFSGLGPAVKPFMEALQKLGGMFNKTGDATKALRPIMTAVMSTVFGWATMAVNAIRGVVTWLLNSGKGTGVFSGAVSVLKAGWAGLVAIFGAVKVALSPLVAILKAVFSNAMVMNGIKTIFSVIAGVIVGVVVVAAGLAAAFAVVAAGIVTAAAVIQGAIYGIVGFIADGIGAAIDALSGLVDGAGGAASGFVDGLIGGLGAGLGAVVAAASNLAAGALSGFKSLLGIHSPSTVLTEHGDEDMAGAVAGGMDKGGAKVKASAKRMGDAAKPEKGKGGGGGEPGAGARNYFDLRGSTFNGCDEGLIRSVLERIWEEVSGEAGAAPEPP